MVHKFSILRHYRRSIILAYKLRDSLFLAACVFKCLSITQASINTRKAAELVGVSYTLMYFILAI